MELVDTGTEPFAREIPHLTRIQLESWGDFLQKDVPPRKREEQGLEAILQETFPIESYDGSTKLDYVHYELGQPRYTPKECKQLGLTYGVSLKVRLRMEMEEETVEEDVYLGDVPLIIGGGQFVVNGSERAIVSQLHRSPGVDFMEEEKGDSLYQSCWIVPQRGSWIEFQVSKQELLRVRIDQSGKFPATILLKAFQPELADDEDLIREYYAPTETLSLDSDTQPDDLIDLRTVAPVEDPETGKTIIEAGYQIKSASAEHILGKNIDEIEVIKPREEGRLDPLILNTLEKERKKLEPIKEEHDVDNHEAALIFLYGKLRPGSPKTLEKAEDLFDERFYDDSRYRLGKVGRFRINRKFGTDIPEDQQTILPQDIENCVGYVMKLRNGDGQPDDIDHLGNRRVRTIDELCAEQVRIGFLRLRRSVEDRLNMENQDDETPKSLINAKPISSAIDYFFARGDLSQVVDQTNPIAQLTHQRRMSALGPSGLNRKRAGMEVRDVHTSHYGRICPIETPEGSNIGLITSLAIYAHVDEYGFLVTPYRVVEDGQVTTDVDHLKASEEEGKILVSVDVPLDEDGNIQGDEILARVDGEMQYVAPEEIDYMDVAPNQTVGVSASLIPFFENDDANRVLMGSNMQRQAVPLRHTERALVKTGMEKYVGKYSDMLQHADVSGEVTRVTANEIEIDDHTYDLKKFEQLNEGHTLNQRPIVEEGDEVEEGEVIADGAATSDGELALGRNVRVAFLPWEGYNYEDAIVISEALLKDEKFVSTHIEDFEVEARETARGREEFTRDIPNISEYQLSMLDEEGIIQEGAYVESGDILVGKVAPKSQTEESPEEKLLNAIFGKAGEEVKDESLRVESGVEGIVVETNHFERKVDLSDEESEEIRKKTRKIKSDFRNLVNEKLDKFIAELREEFDEDVIDDLTFGKDGDASEYSELREILNLDTLNLDDEEDRERAEELLLEFYDEIEQYEVQRDREINQLTRGDELPTGVLEKVTVKIASLRNLKVGDKFAGRHGNKGVVAEILPEEDMPFLPSGEPVEMILNPLGVPSRMNIGQILETHLGWAADELGREYRTPIFSGADEEDIRRELNEAGLPETGKSTLYDGRTGEPFDQDVTVGYMYVMKLEHMVEDKVHARATGPYSLITQQPLGGKARYGGQRFGEMEVWALEAYGAANTLQELLTVKSDDVDGRTKIYESMVKGKNSLDPGMPMSFEVLTKELQGLCLHLELNKREESV